MQGICLMEGMNQWTDLTSIQSEETILVCSLSEDEVRRYTIYLKLNISPLVLISFLVVQQPSQYASQIFLQIHNLKPSISRVQGGLDIWVTRALPDEAGKPVNLLAAIRGRWTLRSLNRICYRMKLRMVNLRKAWWANFCKSYI